MSSERSKSKSFAPDEQVDRLQQFMDEHEAWASKQFPDQDIDGVLEHLKDEVKELIKSPDDMSEGVDAFSLLIRYWTMKGGTALTLLNGAFDKLGINRDERDWGELNDDGFPHHIEEQTND